MTRWTVPRTQSRGDSDLFGYLRWHLGTNVKFTRSGPKGLKCDVRTRDLIEEVSGESTSRHINLRLNLEYDQTRRGVNTVISGPGRVGLHRAVVDKYRSLGLKSQEALLPELFGNLTKIPAIHQVMTPLRAFVLELSDLGSIRLSDKSFRRYDPRKARQYVSILEQLGYVKSDGDAFVPTGRLAKGETSYGEGADVVPQILADALRQASSYMVDVLGWRLMVPYLRWSNAYYWKALEANRLPRLSKEVWTESHVQLYGSPTHGNPRTQLDDMVSAKIVSYNGSGFEGTPEVFEPYRQKALDMPIVREVLAAS